MLSRRDLLRGVGLSPLAFGAPHWARAAAKPSLIAYLHNRDELPVRSRKRWIRALRSRFDRASLAEETADPELSVARSIVSSALFFGVAPDLGTEAAWEAKRAVTGGVPPPIAHWYGRLILEGDKPRSRPMDLALSFAEHYSEEVAPDLVAWWMAALEEGRLADGTLLDTRAALARTRRLMRPLLIDRLRLLARLDRERRAAHSGLRRAELGRDIEDLEADLARAFSRISRRPEVLDPRRRPYDRLRLALDDFGLDPTPEDRWLDPNGGIPPPSPVPVRETAAAVLIQSDGRPLLEPDEPPPLEHLPPQPRAGDSRPWRDPVAQRSVAELARSYRVRLERTLRTWLGTPYRWGNDSPGIGTDCSGLTRSVMAKAFGVWLPRTSRDQFRRGRSVPRRGLRAGDLVFFDTRDDGRIDHVGIFVGDGRFVHASGSRGVVLDMLNARYHRRAYRGARRVLAYPD